MAEETKKETGSSEQENQQQDQDYIQIIDEMRENTVPKEEYEKVKKERSELAKILAKGDFDKQQEQPENKPDVNELRKKIFQENVTNREYWKSTIALRKSILEKEGRDIFLPVGHNVSVTDEDVRNAQSVADAMEECIEQANGSPDVFNALLRQKLRDPIIPIRAKRTA